jgi:hypothetical protein
VAGERRGAEPVARTEGVERNFLAVLAGLDRPRAPGDDDVVGIRRVALADDQRSERKPHRLEAVFNEPARLWGQVGQQCEIGQRVAASLNAFGARGAHDSAGHW